MSCYPERVELRDLWGPSVVTVWKRDRYLMNKGHIDNLVWGAVAIAIYTSTLELSPCYQYLANISGLKPDCGWTLLSKDLT